MTSGNKQELPDIKNLPVHLGVIMDGNGRWAKRRGLPRLAGHRAGMKSVKEIVNACGEIGIRYLTLYAFSVENWLRPKAEVTGLMRILREYLLKEIDELDSQGVKVVASGRIDDLEKTALKILKDCIKRTQHNRGLVLNLALSYGGRAELADAIKNIIRDIRSGQINSDKIDEALVSKYMYHPEIPDPDLIIRTSGEHRLSNFLIWQSAYSEFYFTEVLWPDFGREELLQSLLEFQGRERRFGRI
ncbi:MAG: isoprenyl transferase [Candidatus Edwardsbacteria bacterium]|nr:isoprenyl transferase [Candidatus Edwardsbacteria bacterium]MBU1576968.1 isoprenyl transferase [Candidatus Edwardsbacteria bacterium]MBU2462932.1 isoprenyl transferase [Candidatus Edwardsbacteria bacterium]MBU2594627.1 isoprenyl transferase [Candidatus Edwardsbacteria bacterium]